VRCQPFQFNLRQARLNHCGCVGDYHPLTAGSGLSERGNHVGHRLPCRGGSPLFRQTEGAGTRDPLEVFLIDDVLGANLAGGEPSGANPAADRFRVLVGAAGRLWNRQHCRIILLQLLHPRQREPRGRCGFDPVTARRAAAPWTANTTSFETRLWRRARHFERVEKCMSGSTIPYTS